MKRTISLIAIAFALTTTMWMSTEGWADRALGEVLYDTAQTYDFTVGTAATGWIYLCNYNCPADSAWHGPYYSDTSIPYSHAAIGEWLGFFSYNATAGAYQSTVFVWVG